MDYLIKANWKRGLFRIWLVGTVIWIGISIVMSIPYADLTKEGRYLLEEILAIFGVIVGPPIVVFIAGLVAGLDIAWVPAPTRHHLIPRGRACR